MADVEMTGAGSAAPTATDATNSAVETKYKDAAIIANTVLQKVLAEVAPGKNIAEVCEMGDLAIEAELAKVYKKAKVEKGIAFPTCISVNECVGHYSPLKSESKTLAAGDMVKVDLGVHIDGFMALVAGTTVLGAGAAAPVTGVKADVIAAAHQAAEVALRLIKPGAKNTVVTKAIEDVAAAYGVRPILSLQCQQVNQWTIEGDKTIPLKNDPELGRYKEAEFKLGEVYAVDIAMTSGEGKPKESEVRTTVYRKQLEVQYNMRMDASKKLMSEVNKRFPALPFTLRAMSDEKSARLGITEPLKHAAVVQYPVMFEKEGSSVAHVKFTAMLLPAGTLKVSGLELPEWVKTDKSLTPELAQLRAQPSYVKPAKGSKDVAMSM